MLEESRIAVLDDGASDLRHQAQQIMDIVNTKQMRAGRLLCSEMIDICSRDAETSFSGGTTAGAGAVFLDGSEIIGERGVFEVEDTEGCDGVAEACGSGWPDAVEHVCSQGD